MNRATLCLGANGPDADAQIARAASLLYAMGIAAASTMPYLNMIIELDTELEYEELLLNTKHYQDETRRAAACAPFVAIDIDLVEWNGTVMRPTDATSRYFRKGLELLKEQVTENS